MNTNVLCITVLVLTILIFGANRYAVQSAAPPPQCEKCDCKISVTEVPTKKGVRDPTCSMIYTAFNPDRGMWLEKQIFPLDETTKFSQCMAILYCDKGREGSLDCGGSVTAISQSTACSVVCITNQFKGWADIGCSSWTRQKKTNVDWVPKRSPDEMNEQSMFTLLDRGAPFFLRFVPTKYIQNVTAEDAETKNTITGATRWRVIDGEAGIDQGALSVPMGKVEVQSFCTGDTIRFVGPNVVSLPSCQVDLAGRWKGALARRLADGKFAPVPVSLDLQRAGGVLLKGELKTPDGAFSIASASQNDTGIYIEAAGSVAGKERKFYLNGKITKGSIVLSGSESIAGEKSFKVSGAVRRLYIADNVLRPAALNQPYSFTLTAVSTDSDVVKFRLATPTATTTTKPTTSTNREINWFTQANSLGGHAGGQFTLACPANGSLSGFLAGTDVYKDDSSICKAAAHAGVIIRQAGGAVTIQLKPDAGSYLASTRNGVTSDRSGPWKGSFVFVSGESQGGEPEREPETKREPERGRLPKGLSFDASSGTISGTPTELGSFDLLVVADDGAGSVFEQPFTLTVKKMVLATSLLPDAFFGQAYSATLQVTGGTPPYRFSGIPPKGLTLDPNTGVISGTPTTSRSNSSQFTIRDSKNSSEVQDVLLTVRLTTILNPHFLPEGGLGSLYRTKFEAVGNNTPTKWSIAGEFDIALVGLTLNPDTGELSGTPTRSGSFMLSVKATTAGGDFQTREFTLPIKPGAKVR